MGRAETPNWGDLYKEGYSDHPIEMKANYR
jgi:hypothetical protein